MIDPMSPLDAIFLYAEDGTTHMHIGSCAIFAGPSPSIGEITDLIASKLHLLTRYRQKVRFVPAGLGHPVWVDDPHFDLAYHVRHSALPPPRDQAPGDEHDLENLMGRLMSQELDRHRPLWEAWVIEGLPDDRWALISKVHHCMVDGISGTDLMAVMLDTDPAAPIRASEPWEPEPEPSGTQLAVDAVTRMALNPVRQVLAWRADGISIRGAWERAGDVVAGLRSFSTRVPTPVALAATKPASVEGAIGPHRRWAAGRCTLDDVKTIRAALGGSVNDVVLAAVTGAFRSLMIERGDRVDDDVVLRSLVPVSVRSPDDHSANNQVSMIIAELPVGIADPAARLDAVHNQMMSLKSSHQSTAGAAVVATAAFIPPMLLSLGVRATLNVLRTTPQRAVNTVTTNVPGPRLPLYALGREMLEYLPFVPVSDGVRIGVAILSYNGRISFGITGDYDTAPDVHFMAKRIEEEVIALRELARPRTVAATRRRRAKAAS